MMRLVADTGPVLHLHQAGALHLLPLIAEVILSPRIMSELRFYSPSLWTEPLPDWVKLQTPSTPAKARATAWQQAGLLHSGEAEALSLAVEIKPDWFLTDDAAARLMAESLQIEVHGSLGVVLWVAAKGLLKKSEAEPHLAGLEKSSLWMSPRVRAAAQAALSKIYVPD